jgi:hypothetical protein
MIEIAFPHELAAAIDGGGTKLDEYLELRRGGEVLVDIVALTGYRTMFAGSLRADLAGRAMQGFVGRLASAWLVERKVASIEIAKYSVEFADALIAELEK